MAAADTVAALADFQGRGAGTDAERRAALWLGDQLAQAGRPATLETFWSRPNWALAQAWHALLALAGGLLSVASPKLGGALLIVALVSLAFDLLVGVSLGRRLTPERASQNVVASPVEPQHRVRLLVTANYDSGRMGLVHRRLLRRPAARLRGTMGPAALGWQAWLAVGFGWLLVIAILRNGGADGQGIGIAQLIPTAGLVLAAALLLELAISPYGPGAGDNASGVAVALALLRTLEVSPPRHLDVELVLQGTGDGAMSGLTRYLRAHRRERRPADTIVLGLGACGAGQRIWWMSDGSFLPMRALPRLNQIAARAIGPATEIGARAHRGRGVSPALPARRAGLPALSVGALDRDGLVPRSHLPEDRPDALEPGSLDRMLELALVLVEAIDTDVGRAVSGRSASSPAAA